MAKGYLQDGIGLSLSGGIGANRLDSNTPVGSQLEGHFVAHDRLMPRLN
jgi:hypothetical protein